MMSLGRYPGRMHRSCLVHSYEKLQTINQVLGVGGFSQGAKQSFWRVERRCGMVLVIQGMCIMRERLNTLQTWERGWEKPYESGRTHILKNVNRGEALSKDQPAHNDMCSWRTIAMICNIVATFHFANETSIFVNSVIIAWTGIPTSDPKSLTSILTTKNE